MMKVNQDVLKIIAVVAMTVDHVARISDDVVLMPLVLLGRLAFPIFGFLMMLHLWQNKCYVKYLKRLTVFGILSQVAFIPFGYTSNILISFLWPVLTLYLFEKINQKHIHKAIGYALRTLILIIGIFVSSFCDYHEFGYLYLLLIYAFLKDRTFPIGLMLGMVALMINGMHIGESFIGLAATIALFMIPLSSGRRLISGKYTLYIYYPLHLVILLTLKHFGFFG
ncbi:MAG: hypothetical protein IKY98_05495 [Alphaproteobacteria bacterium]|nr:hypothetical protein [Alphaproteobacteria bacterium]